MLLLHRLSWSSGESVSLLILAWQVRLLCLDRFCSFSQHSFSTPWKLGGRIFIGFLPPIPKITMKGFLLDTRQVRAPWP